MNIGSINCNYQNPCKQSPSFGAIRFTDAGMKVLKAQILNRGSVDMFVKEVKPLICHAQKNPIHVIVDEEANSMHKLFARVEDRKLNFGYDATTTYSQDDKYSFDFLANAVSKADQLNILNKELDQLPKNIIKN